MNGYIAFYGSQQIPVYALTQYAAKCIAVAKFKAPKSKAHLVSVMLCEKDGEPVTHSTASL